jgi:hypothetical protein
LANIYSLTMGEDLFAEGFGFGVMPDWKELPALPELTKGIGGLFVKAAGEDLAIPGDFGTAPEAPAPIGQGLSRLLVSVCFGRNPFSNSLGVWRKQLRCLKASRLHPYATSPRQKRLNLRLIVPKNNHLKLYQRIRASQSSAHSQKPFHPFQNLPQLTPPPITRITLLSHPIYGNANMRQARQDKLVYLLFGKQKAIGAEGSEEPVAAR